MMSIYVNPNHLGHPMISPESWTGQEMPHTSRWRTVQFSHHNYQQATHSISLVPSPHTPPSEKRSGECKLNFLVPQNQWDCEIGNSAPFLSGFNWRKNFLNIARWHCCKSVCKPKKFDLVHQTVFPRERVGSGDETNIEYRLTCMEHDITYMYIHKEKSLQKSVVRGEGVVQGGIRQHIIWLLSSLPTTSRKS